MSIPRTATTLSNISHLKHINTASDLIGRSKQTGNAYIILTGETGLSLYASVPKSFHHRFINAFKGYPKPLVGIAKSRLIKRIIKGLDRFGLVTLILPIILMAIILYMLPDYIFWILVVWVSVWLVINIIKIFKK